MGQDDGGLAAANVNTATMEPCHSHCKHRRLCKDHEKTVRSSEAFVKLAMIRLMLNRLRLNAPTPNLRTAQPRKITYGTDSEYGQFVIRISTT